MVILVIPSVGIGNVCQLSIDLIIEKAIRSNRAQRLGMIRSLNVYPLIGNNPFSSPSDSVAVTDASASASADDSSSPIGSMVTAIEAYQINMKESEEKIIVVQIRSPIVPGRMLALSEELIQFGLSHCSGGERLMVMEIGGADATFRTEDQIRDSRIRYVSSKESVARFPDLQKDLLGMDIIPLEIPQSQSESSKPSSLLISADMSSLSMAGAAASSGASVMQTLPIKRAGMMLKTLSVCQAKSIPMVGFAMFLREGWNIPEAEILATRINQFLKLDLISSGVGWDYPPSWENLVN